MWTSAQINLVGEYTFKAVTILSGTFITWLGARLFEKGIQKGGAELAWKDAISIGKGGPGLVFAALGAVIVVYGIARRVEIRDHDFLGTAYLESSDFGLGRSAFTSSGHKVDTSEIKRMCETLLAPADVSASPSPSTAPSVHPHGGALPLVPDPCPRPMAPIDPHPP